MPKTCSSSTSSSSSSSPSRSLSPSPSTIHASAYPYESYPGMKLASSHEPVIQQDVPVTQTLDLSRCGELDVIHLWGYEYLERGPWSQWSSAEASKGTTQLRAAQVIDDFDVSFRSGRLRQSLLLYPARWNRVPGENDPYRLISGKKATQPLRKKRTARKTAVNKPAAPVPQSQPGPSSLLAGSHAIPAPISTNRNGGIPGLSSLPSSSQGAGYPPPPIASPPWNLLNRGLPPETFSASQLMAQATHNENLHRSGSMSTVPQWYQDIGRAPQGTSNQTASQHRTSQQSHPSLDYNHDHHDDRFHTPIAGLLQVGPFVPTTSSFDNVEQSHQQFLEASIQGSWNPAFNASQSPLPQTFENNPAPQFFSLQTDNPRRYIDPRVLNYSTDGSSQLSSSEYLSSDVPSLEFTTSSPDSSPPNLNSANVGAVAELAWHQTEYPNSESPIADTDSLAALASKELDYEGLPKDKGKDKMPIYFDEE